MHNRLRVLEAASPLVSMLAYASLLQHTQDPFVLLHEIKNSLQAFQDQLKPIYPTAVIKMASYLLCIALDELIIDKLNKIHTLNLERLLVYFHQDSQGEKRFFKIVNVLLETKAFSKELLMIAYFCLLYDYQGAYTALENQLEYFKRKIYLNLCDNKIPTKTPSLPPVSLKKSLKDLGVKMLVFFILMNVGAYALLTFLLHHNIYWI